LFELHRLHDPSPVDESAVGAAEVHDEILVVLFVNARVGSGDFFIPQRQGVALRPPNGTVVPERNFLIV